MDAALTDGRPAPRTATSARLGGILAALAAGAIGYGLAESVTRARTSDAFLVPPTVAQLLGYATTLAVLIGLALALELAAPLLVAQGVRASRNLRALNRRRFRHARTRAEIDNVEVGLTISVCAFALVLALMAMTAKVLLAVSAALAILVTLKVIVSLCRLVGYEPAWSGLVGFLYGLGVGYLLT